MTRKASRTSLRSESQWSEPGRVDKLISLAKDGMAYKDIAVQLNTTATCVRGKLQQMGIKKAQWFKPAPNPVEAKPRTLSAAAKANIQSWEARNAKAPTIRRFTWEEGA